MSRIDEALKRLAGAGKLTQDGLAPVAVEGRFEGSLERYVAEKPSPRLASHAQPRLRPSAAVAPAPRTRERARSAMFQVGLDGKLVVSRQISPISIEQYRRLAATLHDLQQQRQIKSLMVSSALPKEGKTLTITNLALTLSESYHQRVLLIDADLRRPSIHDMFGLPVGTGLADALRSRGGPLPLVEISPLLAVLTAGHQDEASPLAQLTSDRLPAIIAEAGSSFDWILIDTPPVGLLPDAQHVARVCDGALFVIGAGSTPYRMVQRAIAELGPDRIVGTLLNRVAAQELSLHEYGGYYSSDASVDRTTG
jgi:capsular exopolysaccharide synthesis family protein